MAPTSLTTKSGHHTVPPGERAPAPNPARSTVSGLSWTVGLLAAGVLGLDWFFALRGSLSFALTALLSLLLLPWTILLFRGRRKPASAAGAVERPLERGQVVRVLLLRFALFVVVCSLLAAKWMVLRYSGGVDPAYLGSSRSYTFVLALALAVGIVSHDLRWTRLYASVAAHPARLLATSFGATGLVGALLLSLPLAHESVTRVSLVDSLFMAFSAVCITGLSVHNLAETYSLFGQLVLVLLVQIGGLGIMVLSAAIAILAGQRLRVRSSAMLTEVVDGSSLANLRRTVLTICTYTVLIEGTGICLLYLCFESYPEIASRHGPGLSGAGSLEWAAVFHGVSAFCHAGFSNFAEGLFPLRGHPGVMAVLTALIVLGSIGFPVLDELVRMTWSRLRGPRPPQLSLHTRIVLRLSAFLLGGMTLCYLALEWTHTFAGLPYHERLFAAVFQAAAARTAGFNVVDLSLLVPASVVLTCFAMFIGAGPGSTGGGIKVTTVAALFAGLRGELFGRAPTLSNRTLPEAVIRKAIGVTSLSLVIVGVAFVLLLLVESHPPLDLLFETVSAFSTTGLSTGITPKLSTPGKLIIIVMMFIGRIGPLTLALALASKTEQRVLRLPEERVLIG